MPLFRAFLAGTSRTWAGTLEPDEIREAALAYAWVLLIGPCNIAGVGATLALQFAGVAMPAAILPWIAGVVYTGVAVFMWRRHVRHAQRLVAARLGLDPRMAHLIDFRGYEKFGKSVAAARSANGKL